jgi:ankyrin repeat protein
MKTRSENPRTNPQSNPRKQELDADALALVRAAFQYARAGDTARLAWLISAGLPVNLCNENGDSLLMLASYHGHADATRLLLENKAEPDRSNDRGQTPLAGVAFKGDTLVALLLLEYGARVDAAGPDGKTALMFAAMFDKREMVELLLLMGAERGRTDAQGRTALDYARAMNAQSTTELLTQLAKAPEPSTPSPSGRGQG